MLISLGKCREKLCERQSGQFVFRLFGCRLGWEERLAVWKRTLHDEEPRARAVLRARRAERDEVRMRELYIGAIIEALAPLPEARMAVVAAVKRVDAQDRVD